MIELSISKPIVFLLGPGKRRQYKDMRKVQKYINILIREIPYHSYLLYFGDTPEIQRPDIGRVYQKIMEKRKDLHVVMISLQEFKKYGYPKFVSTTYFHSNHAKDGDCKYGGINKNGNPCSNTKVWVRIHNKYGISHIYKIGGGAIATKEATLARKLKIPLTEFKVQHKF